MNKSRDEAAPPRGEADKPASGRKGDETLPESFKDLWKRLFRRTWTWLAGKPRWVQALALIALLAAGLGLARLHFLGDTAYEQTRRLLPWRLRIDPAPVAVPLELVLEAKTGTSFTRVSPDDVLRSGDVVRLSVSAGTDCHVMVLCVDSKGTHPVRDLLGGELSPSRVVAGEHYSVAFELDDTEGPEHYYAVASVRPFSFERQVKEAVSQLFPGGRAKGPLADAGRLPLPSRFTQRHARFVHIGRQQ